VSRAAESLPDEFIGQAALRQGLVTLSQLKEALAAQAREVTGGRARPRTLANILVSKGYLSPDQIAALHEPGTSVAAKPAEKYRVKEELARGGMGAILRAEDPEIRRLVAMKVMLDASDEKGRARFIEEAQVTGQLEHPNIVPVHELGTDPQGRPYFTMKLVKGRSLADVLKGLAATPAAAAPEFTLARLLGIFVNVCNAMAFAHSRGVVHRDLKPANLMLGDYGEVLVMDWGLAKIGNFSKPRTDRFVRQAVPELPDAVRSLRQETPESLTMDGAIMGTPHYMSPEQANGDLARIGPRSDLYSLGAILYEILTLKKPAEGKTVTELLLNVCEGNIQPPEVRTPERNIPRELSAIAMKALSVRPEGRYATAELLRKDIELYLEGRSVSARPDTVWEAAVKLMKRNKAATVATLAAALLVTAAVGAGYWLNLKERRVAESALASFKAEQELRVRQQKASAPSLLAKARGAVTRKEWDTALQDVDVAVAFDPGLSEARLLKAELLVARKEFKAAVEELDALLRVMPAAADATKLKELAAQGERGLTSDLATSLREFFAVRGLHEFSVLFAGSRDALLASYNAIIRKAWPKTTVSVTMNENGTCALRIPDAGITDLSPLRGMPLDQLWIFGNPLSSLEPLRGMPLKDLMFRATNVSDLSPLRGMPLIDVDIGSRVKDLTPLKGMALQRLTAMGAELSDLSPLAGMPLKSVEIAGCRAVTSLEPLRGMPLELLGLRGIPALRDLSPLRGLPLKDLNLLECSPKLDLTPLETLPLEKVVVSPELASTGIASLRKIKTLKSIALSHDQKLPMEEFLKLWDAGAFSTQSGRFINNIKSWKLLGALPLDGPPPASIQTRPLLAAGKEVGGKSAEWRDSRTDYGPVDLATFFGTRDKVAAYAFAIVEVPEKQPVTFFGGNDDTISIWLNGTLIHEDKSQRGYQPNSFEARAELSAGQNLLVLRCGNEGGGDWKFSVGYRLVPK
jgi:serine/threonine protein kinase